jgi:hypothetical protein
MSILGWGIGALAFTATALAPPEAGAPRHPAFTQWPLYTEMAPGIEDAATPVHHDAVRAAAWSFVRPPSEGAFTPHHHAVRAPSHAWMGQDEAYSFVPHHHAVRARTWPVETGAWAMTLTEVPYHDAVRARGMDALHQVQAAADRPHSDAVRSRSFAWRAAVVAAAYVPHHHAVRAMRFAPPYAEAAAAPLPPSPARMKPISRAVPRRDGAAAPVQRSLAHALAEVNEGLMRSIEGVQCLLATMHESYGTWSAEPERAPPGLVRSAPADAAFTCILQPDADACRTDALRLPAAPPVAEADSLYAQLAAILTDRPRPVRARTASEERSRSQPMRGMVLILPGVAIALTVLVAAAIGGPRLQGHARDSPPQASRSSGEGWERAILVIAAVDRPRPRLVPPRRIAPRPVSLALLAGD